MFRYATVLTGVAAVFTIIVGALIFRSVSGYPFEQTFHHDIGAPVLALELSSNADDIEAVLHRGDPASLQAVAKQRRANNLDLIFIPIYTTFLWAIARLFSPRRIHLLTILIVATGLSDYWEDWRIFQALDGKNPAIAVPSVWKWGLLAVVLAITGGIFVRAGGAIYSLASNRLLALGYWASALFMGIAVATGRLYGYSLITLANEVFSVIVLVHVVGLLGRYLRVPVLIPQYTDDFCKNRGVTSETTVAVKPMVTQ